MAESSVSVRKVRPVSPRTLLPLTPIGARAPRHGSRSHMTCEFRCGNACDKPVPNTSDNLEFRDVAAAALARRSVLKGAGAGLGVLAVAGVNAAPAAAAPGSGGPGGKGRGKPGKGRKPRGRGVATASFAVVPPNTNDKVTVPKGYTADVVISWGDPVLPDAPRFDVDDQSGEAAAKQFGYNNDYVGVFPLEDSRGRGGRGGKGRKRRRGGKPARTGNDALLVVNHEYTNDVIMFPEGRYSTAEIAEITKASVGMAVVEMKRAGDSGRYRTRNHRAARLNRRITADTPFRVTGPAAGDPRLRTSADPSGRRVLGTFANCAGGMTPWGTVLSGEENFNGYFDASGELDSRYAESYGRYGIDGSGRGWSEVDDRFDLTTEPNEPFRFGWVVELDPMDPTSTPRKHSMLGRFKHEGANVTVARDGRVVAYMGDDERGDYIYRFVSRDRFDSRPGKAARRRNLTLLSHGTLSVARFDGDGTEDGVYDGAGEWLPLTSDTTSFVPGMSVADVLIDTRLAADTVGPTKMDRPEDIEPSPVNGRVYCALTNNSQRGSRFEVDEANPLATSSVRDELGAPLRETTGNRNGYVLEITPRRGDDTADTFTWDLMLVCGDPGAQETYFAGFPKQLVSPISCPDNVAFDDVGNLWVATDGNVLGSHDGLFRVPVEGPKRGHVEQFLTVPTGAECCGPLITDNGAAVWIAVQHPGESDGATFTAPASTWPGTTDFPRPSVVVTHRS
ncbi:PhoX family phosphatase [Nocardioidaceae bacterium]|nr:PhoX family phosphatase [Nocardioidaceae bacterium]